MPTAHIVEKRAGHLEGGVGSLHAAEAVDHAIAHVPRQGAHVVAGGGKPLWQELLQAQNLDGPTEQRLVEEGEGAQVGDEFADGLGEGGEEQGAAPTAGGGEGHLGGQRRLAGAGRADHDDERAARQATAEHHIQPRRPARVDRFAVPRCPPP